MSLMNAEAIFTHIDQCPSAPPLLLSIRDGSGEAWRAGVQDWRGRRSSFFCTSTSTTLNHIDTSSDQQMFNYFSKCLVGPGGQLQRPGSGCSTERRC